MDRSKHNFSSFYFLFFSLFIISWHLLFLNISSSLFFLHRLQYVLRFTSTLRSFSPRPVFYSHMWFFRIRIDKLLSSLSQCSTNTSIFIHHIHSDPTTLRTNIATDMQFKALARSFSFVPSSLRNDLLSSSSSLRSDFLSLDIIKSVRLIKVLLSLFMYGVYSCTVIYIPSPVIHPSKEPI